LQVRIHGITHVEIVAHEGAIAPNHRAVALQQRADGARNEPGDLNFNRLIPGTIRALLQGDRPVIRSDGTFVRDYFYVRDAVNAYLQLAERMPGEAFCGEAFNFGTETPMTVLEVVDRLLAVMGISGVTPQILGEASHEIPKQFLDCAKARARMDWHPHFTFDAALADTVVWYREWLAARQRPVVGNG